MKRCKRAARFPMDWRCSKAIVIMRGMFCRGQKNFPLQLSARQFPAGFFGDVQDDGGDIRFTKDKEGKKPLHAELADIDVGRRSVCVWVKLPRIYARSDTVFYAWYKSAVRVTFPPADDPVWGGRGVWDKNFVSVHHG